MKRYGYDKSLATGTVAAAGSLGILIPPSTIFIIYGILTEQSIGKLFAAGILPGVLLSSLFIAVIYFRVRLNPTLAPEGPKTSLTKKIRSFVGVVETLVMGGFFSGSSPRPKRRPSVRFSHWSWPLFGDSLYGRAFSRRSRTRRASVA
jgi:TRAP-type C4-dicarboxylate transport system permease large subunit